jgi:hypothetical protein
LLLQEEEPPPLFQGAGVAMAVAATASTEIMAVYFIFELIKAIAKTLGAMEIDCESRFLLGSLVPLPD